MLEYTTCVQPGDYQHPPLPQDGLSTVLNVAFASVPLLLDTCEYILHGKLVCLGGDRCAIGRVTGIETVDDKSFPDTIGNDFSINILLSPWDPSDFARGETLTRLKNYEEVVGNAGTGPGIQGELIREQPGMPVPFEPIEDPDWPHKRYGATYTDFPSPNFGTPIPYPTSSDKPVRVPTLHCEIEGERINAVCSTVAAMSSPIPGWGGFCRKNAFFRALCKLIGMLAAPLIWIGAAIAWAAGSSDNRDFQGGGSLGPGDRVVITGRWAYDAGHDGWNELHPVKSIQRIDDDQIDRWDRFEALHGRWCPAVSIVPPVTLPGVRPIGMTSTQETVYDAQQRPENRWNVHPLLDGCRPADDAAARSLVFSVEPPVHG